MTDRTHPDSGRIITSGDVIAELHDRIAGLEAQLEAVGAGGVAHAAVAGPSGYGPKATVKRSCSDCKACNSESYAVQGDSGHYVYCEHPSLPESKYIGDTNWNTPHWCPVAAPATQPAPDEIINMAREQGLPETETEGVFIVNVDDLGRIFAAYRAARAPADSVLEDAARYRYLRDVPMDQWPAELLTAIRLQKNAKWDAAIDAARKQGGA